MCKAQGIVRDIVSQRRSIATPSHHGEIKSATVAYFLLAIECGVGCTPVQRSGTSGMVSCFKSRMSRDGSREDSTYLDQDTMAVIYGY